MRETDDRRAALMHQVEYTNKLASVGRLAAGVAHEINNPLAIINEKAGLLRDLVQANPETPNREKLLATTDSVLRSVQRCKTVTHRLLGFARHMDVEKQTIALDSVVKEVLGFLEKEAEYRNLIVALEVADGVPQIVSDQGQLQQVFLNILNNAFAAVPDGGRIDIAIEPHGDDLVAVKISDNGVGIPKEHMERIFEPFFTTKHGAGTGLGLSITYGIVKKLGGEVRVESERGQGTRFTVILPRG
jgi:two-component system NtrC family sensor kinase